ncbi:LCP family protein [Propionibacteriaceae bacterium Y2011]
MTDRARSQPSRVPTTPSGAAAGPSRAAAAAARVKLRRGLTCLGMTLVLPGSVQLATGNRAVGRIALRVWGLLWALAGVLALLLVFQRELALRVLTSGWLSSFAQVALVVVGVGWAFLFLDAWRLGRPGELARQHRPGYALLSLALVITVLSGSIGGARAVSAQQDVMGHVFAGGGETEADHGRINVLLLGGDAGANRVGLRPDSITLASIDADTGRTVLFSLPRNMEDVPFPETSPMYEHFPDGFTCEDHGCMLNGIYTWASEHPELWPGVADPGAQATKEAVEHLTGLKINYYAMVDLQGFESLIDAVGGINLDITKRVPIGGGSSPITGWIEPGENVHLDGHDALWFARSREGSNDFERMERQKCVMNAMLNQLDPVTVLARFQQISQAGKQIMATDVPRSETGALVDLALKAREHKIGSVSFVPPLIYPGSPDFAKMRQVVADEIAASEAKDNAPTPEPSDTEPSDTEPSDTRPPAPAASSTGPSAPPASRPPASPTAGASTTSGSGEGSGGGGRPSGGASTEARTQVEDLGSLCRAR